MPKTANAPTQEKQATEPKNASGAEGQTEVHSVELPEVSEGQTSGAGGQLDILLDMDVTVTVVLGATQIPVRRLLQLGPGAVLKLQKSIEAPVDLYLKDSKFAEAEVVVVDNRFAVRIKRIVGEGVGIQASQG